MARINIPIQVEANNAKKEIAEFNKEMRSVEQTSRLTIKELEASGRYYDALTAKQKGLAEQLKIQNDVAAKARDGYAAQGKALEEYAKKVEAAKKALEDAKSGGTATAAELNKLEAAVARVGGEYGVAEKRLSDWERVLTQAEAKERLLAASITNTTRELEAQSDKLGDIGRIFLGNLSATAVFDSLKGMISDVTGYFSDASRMASEYAENQGKLTQVMGNTMDATAAQVKSINDLTTAQERFGVVSRTVQTSGAQELATYLTKAETLQKLIPVMNDMIAQQNGINATQQSAANIATMLGKVMDGQVGALSRYGYKFDELQEKILKTGTEAERAAVLIDVISASVGGMNEALAKTDAGRQAQLNFVLQETQMRIGEIWNAMRAEAGAAALPAVQEMSAALLKLVEDNKDNIRGLFGAITGLFDFIVRHSGAVKTGLAAVGGGLVALKLTEVAGDFKKFRDRVLETIPANVAAAASEQELAAAKIAGAGADGVKTAAANANTASNIANAASIKAVTAAMMTSPLFIGAVAGAAIYGIVKAVDYLTSGYERQAEKVRALSEEYKRMQADVEDTERKMKNVGDRIDELNSKDKLTVVEQDELDKLEAVNEKLRIQLAVQKEIAAEQGRKTEENTVKALEKKVMSYGDDPEQRGRREKVTMDERIRRNIEFYNELKKSVEELEAAEGSRAYEIEFQKALMETLRSDINADMKALDEYGESLVGATENGRKWAAVIDETRTAVGAHIDAVKEDEAALKKLEDTMNGVSGAADSVGEKLTAAQLAITAAVGAYEDLNDAYAKGEIKGREYVKSLAEQINTVRGLAAEYPELAAQYNAVADVMEQRLMRAPEYLEDMQAATSDLAGSVESLSRAFEEQARNEELSAKTALDMIKNGYAAALAVDAKTGAIRLNEQAYKDLMTAEIEEQIASLTRSKNAALIDSLEAERQAAILVAQGYLDLADAKYREIEASRASGRRAADDINKQISVLESMRAKIGQISVAGIQADIASKGGRKTDAEAEAERARKEELKKWEDHYKDRENESKKWIDRQKFYGEMSLAQEIEASDRVLAYLKQYKAEAAVLTYATEDEKLKITREIGDKIEAYERARYTASKKLLQDNVKDLTDFWRGLDAGLTSGIDKRKFYGDMPVEDEIEAYRAALVDLEDIRRQANEIVYASAEERDKVLREIADKTEGYERKLYTARKQLAEEEMGDAADISARRERQLQKDLSNAETAEAKYRALIALRADAQEELTRKLKDISDKFWLSEKAKLKEMEAAYDQHKDKMDDINKQMYDLRRERMQKEAGDWYAAQKKMLDDSYRDRKESLNKELAAIREHYKALDAEERARDRSQELGDLEAQAGLYAGAATKEGQDKYKSLIQQIERLKKEADREARQEAQKAQEAEVAGRMDALEKTYNMEQDMLKKRYDEMQKAADDAAKRTASNLEDAAAQLTGGLEDIFDIFGVSLDRFGGETVEKIKDMISKIAEMLKSVNFNFGAGNIGAGQTNNYNSRSASVTLNDYGAKNFNNQAAADKYWAELTSLALHGLTSRIG